MGECLLEGKGGGEMRGVEGRLLRLQVKIMCRSGEICRQHFYSFFDYLPSLCCSFCVFVCLFVFGISVTTVGTSARVRTHADEGGNILECSHVAQAPAHISIHDAGKHA